MCQIPAEPETICFYPEDVSNPFCSHFIHSMGGDSSKEESKDKTETNDNSADGGLHFLEFHGGTSVMCLTAVALLLVAWYIGRWHMKKKKYKATRRDDIEMYQAPHYPSWKVPMQPIYNPGLMATDPSIHALMRSLTDSMRVPHAPPPTTGAGRNWAPRAAPLRARRTAPSASLPAAFPLPRARRPSARGPTGWTPRTSGTAMSTRPARLASPLVACVNAKNRTFGCVQVTHWCQKRKKRRIYKS